MVAPDLHFGLQDLHFGLQAVEAVVHALDQYVQSLRIVAQLLKQFLMLCLCLLRTRQPTFKFTDHSSIRTASRVGRHVHCPPYVLTPRNATMPYIP